MDKKLNLLGLKAVMEMTGLSKTTIYTLKNGFPQPVKIHGAGATSQSGSRWVEAEVIEWIQSLISLRDMSRGAK